MKKKIFFIAFSFLISTLWAQQAVSDVALFNEINIAFKNQFYPGAVEKSATLQKNFPDSVYIQQVLAIKGESLIRMGNYDDAVETLQQAVSHMHTGSREFPHCLYLLAQAYLGQKNYDAALRFFYKTCTVSLSEASQADGLSEFYHLAVFYSAKVYYITEDYDKALPLFEQALQNRSAYSSQDYEEILQKYMLCANKSGNPAKTEGVFAQIKSESMGVSLYNTLKLYAADAKELLGKSLEAYNFYCDVVECGDETLAVIALKKAYNLSEKKNIGVNPGDVFSKTAETFSENPELVNEFWIRLGIDEYNNKNYKKAESYFANDRDNSPLVTIYRAKIILDTDSSARGAQEAQELLAPSEEAVLSSPVPEIVSSYYSVLLQCKIQGEKWAEVPAVYAKLPNPSLRDDYILSAYYYRLGDYKKVLADSGVLYASALARDGQTEKSAEAFEVLYNKNQLPAEYAAEYAKVLFSLKRFSEAYTQALRSTDRQKDYVCALCQLNLRNWSTAKNHFSSYISALSGKGDFNNLVFYYKGYCEYNLSEYKNAYASFVRFCTETDESLLKMKRAGYEYAAKSALQAGDLKNASVQAENVMKYSVEQQEKQDAVVFASEVFADVGDFQRALSVLRPYTAEKTDFATEALFRSALILERMGDADNADKTYAEIFTKYPKSPFAEEAMYRPGEIFYARENYALAFNRFNAYIYQYAAGKFAESALFFGGDSACRLGETNRTVLLNKTLLQRYPQSVYAYSAYKNLMNAYYEQESYQLALETARQIVKEYPALAKTDGIQERMTELERIIKGTDKRVAQKLAEYEKKGGKTTKAGRIAGSELVKLYAEDSAMQKEALDLAVSLLEYQKDDDEMPYAAENAELVADYYRRNQNVFEAANMYLKAAQFYRATDSASKAASALYSATEAFASEGYMGDASETARLLQELYPQTRYAQRVGDIIK